MEDLKVGAGQAATRGSQVEIRYDLSLNRGETVETGQLERFRVGERRVIEGLEYGVEGMRVGGRRRIWVGPHLGYRQEGVPGRIPEKAVLVFVVVLLGVKEPASGPARRRRG